MHVDAAYAFHSTTRHLATTKIRGDPIKSPMCAIDAIPHKFGDYIGQRTWVISNCQRQSGTKRESLKSNCH